MDIASFVSAPTLEALDNCKRADLAAIARKLEISLKFPSKNRDMRDAIVVELVDQGLLEEECLDTVIPSDPTSEAMKIKQMELENKLKIERERIASEQAIRFRELELQCPSSSSPPIKLTSLQSSVPKFSDEDLVRFFKSFEFAGRSYDWPLDKYTTLLSPVLTGKAADVFTSLSPNIQSDYPLVKEAILKAYELTPEA